MVGVETQEGRRRYPQMSAREANGMSLSSLYHFLVSMLDIISRSPTRCFLRAALCYGLLPVVFCTFVGYYSSDGMSQVSSSELLWIVDGALLMGVQSRLFMARISRSDLSSSLSSPIPCQAG